MAVPDHYFSGAGSQCALHRRIHLAGQNMSRFQVSPLSWQELLVGIGNSAGTLQVGHDQNPRALRKTGGAEQKQAHRDSLHGLTPWKMPILYRTSASTNLFAGGR